MSRRLNSGPSATGGPAGIFISNSPRDERWLDLLLRHLGVLATLDIVELWSYRCIGAGEIREKAIFRAIDTSQLAILLISADFLVSKDIMNTEVPRILDRHRTGELAVLPVLVEPCLWEKVPWLQELQMSSWNPGKPLSSLRNRDQREAAAVKIVEEVLRIMRSS